MDFDVTVYLDETGTHGVESALMVGAIVTHDRIGMEDAVRSSVDDLLADPAHWKDENRRQRFSDRGFHYSEDDVTTRTIFVERIRQLNYRFHGFYSRRTFDGIDDEGLQILMFNALVKNILRRYPGQAIMFVFEENQSMNRYFGPLLNQAVSEVVGTVSVPPSRIGATLGRKPLAGLSVVDYFLAIVAPMVKPTGTQHNPQDFERIRLARMLPNVAQIVDFDSATHRRASAMINMSAPRAVSRE